MEAYQPAAHVDAPPVVVDADESSPRAVLESQQPRAAVEEVAGVLEEVEGDEVRAQERTEHLIKAGWG